MSDRHTYRHAAVATLLVLVTLVALLLFARDTAAGLMHEDDAVEWLQVALFAVAGIAAVVAARRPPGALDVLLAVLLFAFVELEVDLDRRLFGRPVIDKRFLLDNTVALVPRAFTALCLLGLTIGVAAYAWRRRASVGTAARRLVRAPWGRLFLAGLAILVLVEVFEKSLNNALPLPRYFLEESLELLSAVYCCLAMIEHARDATS